MFWGFKLLTALPTVFGAGAVFSLATANQEYLLKKLESILPPPQQNQQ
ncbi:hypothetical protein [Mycoplasma wenyonii]|nr:hypothetical protein [Mycoplasma wenyonii]